MDVRRWNYHRLWHHLTSCSLSPGLIPQLRLIFNFMVLPASLLPVVFRFSFSFSLHRFCRLLFRSCSSRTRSFRLCYGSCRLQQCGMSHLVSCCQAKHDNCLKTLDDLKGERPAAWFEWKPFAESVKLQHFEVQVGKRSLHPWNKPASNSDTILWQLEVCRAFWQICLCWFGNYW